MKNAVNRYENSWQGCMSLKMTFDDLEKIDIQEIRELLDEDQVFVPDTDIMR